MTRGVGFLASLTLVVMTVARLPAAGSADLATPAPLAATPTGGEIEGAVPVSLIVENTGNQPDHLLGGSTLVAERVAVHVTRLVDGRREMQAVPDGVEIPAGATLLLEPGRSHLMLFSLRVPLVQGETFPLTLCFHRAGEATVTVRVRRRVDAAGITPVPAVVAGDLRLSLASAPPAPAERSEPGD